ncbi:MAG: HAMP domain-containing sensor histidine kinase [Oscillospiraceae bacterium]
MFSNKRRMKKTDKVNSTAARIKILQSRRMNRVLVFVNISLLLLALIGWCYVNDSAYAKETNPFVLMGEVSRGVNLVVPSGNADFLIEYTMSMQGMLPKTVDATPFFYILIVSFFVVSFVECAIVAISNLFAKRQINKQLEPLYELARSAKQLSVERYEKPVPPAAKPAVGEESLHSLEHAIAGIKPERAGVKLYTGYEDTRGIEDAINSLMDRTRESYDRQIRFVSDASHELRTPIAVLKGYIDMLDRWGKSDEKTLDESIAAIKAETDHMSALIEQLLFLARGDSGKLEMNSEYFFLRDMVRDVFEEYKMIDTHHLWEIYDSEKFVVTGDYALLKQATRILVDNAAKYTEKGKKITISAKKGVEGEPCIVVQDSGIGISSDDMEHIFDRFYRADTERDRSIGGTGLGLSIAKWIVDRHEGVFEVVSYQDIGTRITIRLPKQDGKKPKSEEETI